MILVATCWGDAGLEAGNTFVLNDPNVVYVPLSLPWTSWTGSVRTSWPWLKLWNFLSGTVTNFFGGERDAVSVLGLMSQTGLVNLSNGGMSFSCFCENNYEQLDLEYYYFSISLIVSFRLSTNCVMWIKQPTGTDSENLDVSDLVIDLAWNYYIWDIRIPLQNTSLKLLF